MSSDALLFFGQVAFGHFIFNNAWGFVFALSVEFMYCHLVLSCLFGQWPSASRFLIALRDLFCVVDRTGNAEGRWSAVKATPMKAMKAKGPSGKDGDDVLCLGFHRS